MHFPRLPDWLVYLAVVVTLAVAALGRRERADAPPAPPPFPSGPVVALGPASPFDPAVTVRAPSTTTAHAGTAFSIGDGGVWVTARHVVAGCARAAILVGRGRGVTARARPSPDGEAVILTTRGGAPALPLLPQSKLERGMRAFHPGFPGDRPGEVASRLIGRETLTVRGRGARPEPVLVWAQVGRTSGQSGSLAGLSGAPALDSSGRVIGVTIAQAPRRGRIYTTTPENLRAALKAGGLTRAPEAAGESIGTDNYGRVADDLRRDLRVAQVVCLSD
ncbi:MAG TPA: serine protease [Caulobacteraceae bacterium]